MIHLRLHTEYSFRRAFGKIPDVLAAAGGNAAAITDYGTWGHVAFAKVAKKMGVKPIFGVEVPMVLKPGDRTRQSSGQCVLLARDNVGLAEIYRLVTWANAEGFYYEARVGPGQIEALSDHVFVLLGPGAMVDRISRDDHRFLMLTPENSYWNAKAVSLPWRTVVAADNIYPSPGDRGAYEILASRNKRSGTTLLHIPDEYELKTAIPEALPAAFAASGEIAALCNATLPSASIIRPDRPLSLYDMCILGARKRGMMVREYAGNIFPNELADPIYQARLIRELDLIRDKGFEDYFYVIAEMVTYAKTMMMVGPGRGSSAGSLACYLLGITDVDPIRHGLLFERFIDITRADLPDIDIDFQDDRRELVIEHLRQIYGASRVGRLGTVMRYKAKSTLTDVGKELGIPAWEMTEVKDAMIERSSGDARAAFCIADTLDSLDVGKALVLKYPEVRVAAELEDHARQSGMHAAGIIVCQEPVATYCAIDKSGAAQIDKKDAEVLNLLKIDALGLRTLSVIQDCLDQIGRKAGWLVTYPLDDTAAFEIFNTDRFAGVFQYEGYALQALTRQMKVREFNDIVVITALARPGPLHCGAATEFVERRTGRMEVKHLHPLIEPITRDTLGIIVYQEQVLGIGRTIGRLSWEDVTELRKAMSKTLGDEFFNTYWEKFCAGAVSQGIAAPEARAIWERMCTFGCLSGETIIQLPTSNQSLTIAELYKNNRSAHQRQRAQILNFQHGQIVPAHLLDVYQSGVKETWCLNTYNGYTIRATGNHQFLTLERGWQPLSALHLNDKIAVVKGKKQIWDAILTIYSPRREMTYDIAMPTPHNNFVANGIVVHNSWSFNASHAVSYGMVSYWCAVLKAHYPLEYAAACLRNTKDTDQGVKLLRELSKEGFAYVPVDPKTSGLTWTVVEGKLVGGLTNVKGIGMKTAQEILLRRATGKALAPGVAKKLIAPVTPYDDIFEGERRFGAFYTDPKGNGVASGAVSLIADIQEPGQYVFLGKIRERNLRDLNEYQSLVKRGGRVIRRHNLFLVMTLEDDSGSIICRVNRFDYATWGKPIVETGKDGEWYLWKGRVNADGWRLVNIEKWRKV